MDKKLLTKKELEIFQLILINKTDDEIAKQLGVSSKTVKNHISNVIQKLGSTNRVNAILELLLLKEISLDK